MTRCENQRIQKLHEQELGFKHISDINGSKHAMRQIDDFRTKMSGKNISLQDLLADSAKDKK